MVPGYKPSLQGVHYGKLLFRNLPDGTGCGRFYAFHNGDDKAIEFSTWRCSRWHHSGWDQQTKSYQTVREVTGGAGVEVRISTPHGGYRDKTRKIYLRIGWTEKSVVRAVTRLHAWAVAELNRAALLAQLDKASEPFLKDDRFGLAVEEQEKLWGVSDYDTMTPDQISCWTEWVRSWSPGTSRS